VSLLDEQGLRRYDQIAAPLLAAPPRGQDACRRPARTTTASTSMSIDRGTHSLFGVPRRRRCMLVRPGKGVFGMKNVLLSRRLTDGPTTQATICTGSLSYSDARRRSSARPTRGSVRRQQVRGPNIHSGRHRRGVRALNSLRAPGGAVYKHRRQAGSLQLIVHEAIELSVPRRRSAARVLALDSVADPRLGVHRWWISDMTATSSATSRYGLLW